MKCFRKPTDLQFSRKREHNNNNKIRVDDRVFLEQMSTGISLTKTLFVSETIRCSNISRGQSFFLQPRQQPLSFCTLSHPAKSVQFIKTLSTSQKVTGVPSKVPAHRYAQETLVTIRNDPYLNKNNLSLLYVFHSLGQFEPGNTIVVGRPPGPLVFTFARNAHEIPGPLSWLWKRMMHLAGRRTCSGEQERMYSRGCQSQSLAKLQEMIHSMAPSPCRPRPKQGRLRGRPMVSPRRSIPMLQHGENGKGRGDTTRSSQVTNFIQRKKKDWASQFLSSFSRQCRHWNSRNRMQCCHDIILCRGKKFFSLIGGW